MQLAGAHALSSLAANQENQATTAIAGAIPALVQLLRPGSPAIMQEAASSALRNLAFNNFLNQTIIAAAGALHNMGFFR
ncbi:hypothetical protein FOA52_006016 [Chlamydomonas sp. UWO 241]|nr:hypothetical protein FOA52_006016 [Chlamydomonas sp. UWO 241]